jgi:hypothetical protein
VAFVAVGGGALVWRPCVLAAEFSPELDGLRAGDSVLLVSNPTHWRMVAGLAAERQLEPLLERRLAEGTDHGARLAFVETHLIPAGPLPLPWEEVRAARGWVLLRRR